MGWTAAERVEGWIVRAGRSVGVGVAATWGAPRAEPARRLCAGAGRAAVRICAIPSILAGAAQDRWGDLPALRALDRCDRRAQEAAEGWSRKIDRMRRARTERASRAWARRIEAALSSGGTRRARRVKAAWVAWVVASRAMWPLGSLLALPAMPFIAAYAAALLLRRAGELARGLGPALGNDGLSGCALGATVWLSLIRGVGPPAAAGRLAEAVCGGMCLVAQRRPDLFDTGSGALLGVNAFALAGRALHRDGRMDWLATRARSKSDGSSAGSVGSLALWSDPALARHALDPLGAAAWLLGDFGWRWSLAAKSPLDIVDAQLRGVSWGVAPQREWTGRMRAARDAAEIGESLAWAEPITAEGPASARGPKRSVRRI